MADVQARRATLLEREDHIEQASRALKAMAHPLRLKILCVLGNREVSVPGDRGLRRHFAEQLSQHLAILREKGCCAQRQGCESVFTRG